MPPRKEDLKFEPLWPSMRLDRTNKIYGRLRVLGHAGDKFWWCECECGTITKVWGNNLGANHTKSCGCLKVDRFTKHGGCKHPLYATWWNMKQRCLNPNYPNYSGYGARGIKIYEEWVSEDPWPFIKWVEENLGPKPKGCTLDRIDNDGDYEPGNLRWATPKQQQMNTRLWNDTLL